MRERSETIYADNEDNYKGLSIIEPTIEEKEKEDEKNLLNAIENLNRNKFKNKLDKKLSLKLISENLQDKFDYDLQIILSNESLEMKNTEISGNDKTLKDSLYSKMSLSKNSTEVNTFSFENSQMEAILNQNFIDFEHIFKLIVIGDKGVGKTLFIDRFVSEEHLKSNVKQIYIPTECLEIKKTFTKISNINTKIELWDTNLSILNSHIIKTYLKISNGLVLIADYDRVDSLSFLEKQIEIILNISNCPKEILLIVNKRSVYGGLAAKDNSLVESKIKYLKNRFDISPVFLNLWKYWRGINGDKIISIQKFLENIMINKLGEKNKVRKQNSLSKKILPSKSPTKIKKISNSNTNSPNRIEFSNYLNIAQKRTRSVKKSLNDVFEKLKLESI